VRTIFAHPGNVADAQNAALALAEAGALQAYVTTFAYRADGALAGPLRRLPEPAAERLRQALGRRAVEDVPLHLIRCHPAWELVRTAAAQAGAGPVLVDRIWDRMSHAFDALVARRYVPHALAVHAFEYTALASFERAKDEGVARVLYLPSLDSLEFESIRRRETCQWPELVGKHDGYFDRKFASRYERRCHEVALADVIITNSALTARSHIAAGADPAKVFSVPLAAPPTIDGVVDDDRARERPLAVMWAGTFSVRKGAHYLVEAWRQFGAGERARLEVYGQLHVPSRLSAAVPENVTFHGSVPKAVLYEAYRTADILAFPTLSDGFGLVVSEAMAHGLPVITTDRAGAADLVSQDNGLIVPAANPRALAEALQWCLDNRQRLQAMRHHALATARRRQWPTYRRELLAALETGLQRAGYSAVFRNTPSRIALSQ
jgi:glycosyltransferase involved in cell wall biosynthesis